MSANHDGDGTRVTVTQDGVDLIERHAVHGAVVDFHKFIATPAEASTGSHQQAHQQDLCFPEVPVLPGLCDETSNSQQ